MSIRNTTDNVLRESNISELSISSLTLSGDSLITAANKLQFRDTGLYINSGADGKLTISSDGSGADDITLSGAITLDDNITTGSGKGFASDFTMATDKKIYLRDSGLYIHSSADGKITISADGAGTDDITLSGTVSVSDDMLLATDKKVGFRDAGIFIQSSADGKLTISSDGAGTDDITLSGAITLDDDLITPTDKKIQFRDSALYINSSTDGQMDIDADVELEITAPLVDLNGALSVSGRVNQELWQFEDDFNEGAAALASCLFSKAFWTGGGTSGTQAVVAGVNGIMQLDTTATGSRSSTLTFTNANFDTNYAPGMECKIKQDDITNSQINFGWYVDTNDCLMFRFDTAVDAANIYLISENNNGGEVSTDTGVDLVAGTYLTAKIQINADETFTAYINGVRVAAAHAGTIRQLATFKPYFYTDNKAAAESKKLDIDYVKIWQNRV